MKLKEDEMKLIIEALMLDIDEDGRDNVIAEFHQKMIILLINTKLSDFGENDNNIFTNFLIKYAKMDEIINNIDTTSGNEIEEFILSNKKKFEVPKLWKYWNKGKLSFYTSAILNVENKENEYGRVIPGFRPNLGNGFSKYMKEIIDLHNDLKFQEELKKFQIKLAGIHQIDPINDSDVRGGAPPGTHWVKGHWRKNRTRTGA